MPAGQQDRPFGDEPLELAECNGAAKERQPADQTCDCDRHHELDVESLDEPALEDFLQRGADCQCGGAAPESVEDSYQLRDARHGHAIG